MADPIEFRDYRTPGPQKVVSSGGNVLSSSKHTGDGNGGGGGLEQRVRQLENDMAFIKGKLDDMPTKDWITTRLFWVVGAFVALSAVIQLIIEAI